VGSAIWSIFTARHYVNCGICRRHVSAGFVLTIALRGPSAIAELLVKQLVSSGGLIRVNVQNLSKNQPNGFGNIPNF